MSLVEIFLSLGANNPVILSLVGGIVCALFNLAGATPVLLLKRMPEKALNVCLGSQRE